MTQRIHIYVVTAFFLVVLSSCCHKKGCSDNQGIQEVRVSNFDPAEIDTLLFTSFDQNSGFTNKIDSFFNYAFPYDTSHTRAIQMNFFMDVRFDWQVKIVATNAQYRISDFSLEKKSVTDVLPEMIITM